MKTPAHLNYRLRVEDHQLIISIALNEEQVETLFSAGGKMVILSQTKGFVPVPTTSLRLNLILYRKP